MLFRSQGQFQPDSTTLVDSYLAVKGLLGTIPDSSPFDWNSLFAGLISHKLKPSEIAALTLTEALLYTITNDEKAGVSLGLAMKKIEIFRSLSTEDRIAVAILRSGG